MSLGIIGLGIIKSKKKNMRRFQVGETGVYLYHSNNIFDEKLGYYYAKVFEDEKRKKKVYCERHPIVQLVVAMEDIEDLPFCLVCLQEMDGIEKAYEQGLIGRYLK
ncbi:MAG TPA: hypothetical protein VLA74_01155 [Nitrososphaeraceae archaeon]|nr:hypothetical protein [Nitrososphaeraceae archaeon]